MSKSPRQDRAPLSREAILAQSTLRTKEVDVPEWGGKIHIRVMSGAERDRYETWVAKNKSENIRARTVIAAICDGQGNLLFTENDLEAVGKLEAKALDRIFEEIIPFNAIGAADIAALKKNSSPILSEGSSSSSVSPPAPTSAS